jgi:hypothetical protein
VLLTKSALSFPVLLLGVDPLGDVAFAVDPLGDVAFSGTPVDVVFPLLLLAVDPLGDVALLLSCAFPVLLLLCCCSFPALLLSCPFPELLFSSDDEGEAEANELPNANAWLFDVQQVLEFPLKLKVKSLLGLVCVPYPVPVNLGRSI